MKKDIYEYTYEEFEVLDVLDAEGDCIAMRDIVFEAEMDRENDGIGSYEFWGTKGYDSGTDYWSVSNVGWNEKLYTEQENADIRKWVDDNWFELVDRIVNAREGISEW